jgi:hypothetical protein
MTLTLDYKTNFISLGRDSHTLNVPRRVDTYTVGAWRHQGRLHFIRFKKNNDVITRGEIIVKIKVKPSDSINVPAIKGKMAVVRLKVPLIPAYIARLSLFEISSKMSCREIV